MEALLSPLSSRACDFFDLFVPFAHLTRSSTTPQSRHPERSASQIRRIKKDLRRGVEGPRRCLLTDALLGFPTTNYKGNQKVTSSDRSVPGNSGERSGETCGSLDLCQGIGPRIWPEITLKPGASLKRRAAEREEADGQRRLAQQHQ